VQDLARDALRELLDYDPETGVFKWRKTGRGRKRVEAGAARRDGRVVIRINKKLYLRSRLAFLWMTGEWPGDRLEVDHIDGDPTNDRWDNLRLATSSQNKHNRRARKESRSGLKGAIWHERDQSWAARIMVDGRNLALGTFKTPEEAHQAYCAAAELHFGTFARVN